MAFETAKHEGKKIAILFKSEVRKLNKDYIAGSERIFLKDVEYFLKTKQLSGAYCAASTNRNGILKEQKIKRLFYPHTILDMAELWIDGNLLLPARIRYWLLDKLKKLRKTFNYLYVIQFILRERKADLLYVYDTPFVLAISSKKAIITYQNYYENQGDILGDRKKISNSRFIFCSNSLKAQMTKSYSLILSRPVDIVYNSIDIEMFRPNKEYKKKPSRIIKFLYASSWVKEKGIQVLADVIEVLNKNRRLSNKVEFLIAGSVDLWSLSKSRLRRDKNLSERMEKLSLRYKNVSILGRVDFQDLPGLYSSVDFCIFPSIWEDPFPLVVIESLACGTPVLAFKVGGVKEVIKNNYNGFLVSEKNASEMAGSIEKVVNNFSGESYSILSNNCRRSALKYADELRNKSISSLVNSTF